MAHDTRRPGDDLTVQVIVGDKPLHAHNYHGHLFICGEPGKKYKIRLFGDSSIPCVAVVTIDGLSLKTGSRLQKPEVDGFVLSPFRNGHTWLPGTRTFDGYEVSPTSRTARSAQTNQAENEFKFLLARSLPDPLYPSPGVIGIRFYRQNYTSPQHDFILRYDDALGLASRGILIRDSILEADPFPEEIK